LHDKPTTIAAIDLDQSDAFSGASIGPSGDSDLRAGCQRYAGLNCRGEMWVILVISLRGRSGAGKTPDASRLSNV
jgi:hypothetical protein